MAHWLADWRNRNFHSGAALAVLLLVLLANGVFAQDAAQPPTPPPSPPVAAPQPPPADRPGFIHQLGVWWSDATSTVNEKIKGLGGKTDNKADDLKKKPDDAAKSAAEAPKGATEAPKGAADAAKDAAKSTAAAGGDAVNSAVEATKGAATTATDAVKGAATTATDAMKGAFEATKNAATSIAKLPNTRVVDMRETCAKAPNGASDCTDAAANGCRGKGFAGGKALEVRTAEKCDIAGLQSGRLPSRDDCGVETTVIRAVCQ